MTVINLDTGLILWLIVLGLLFINIFLRSIIFSLAIISVLGYIIAYYDTTAIQLASILLIFANALFIFLKLIHKNNKNPV